MPRRKPSELIVAATQAAQTLSSGADELRRLVESIGDRTKADRTLKATLLSASDRFGDVSLVLSRELDRAKPTGNLLRRFGAAGVTVAATLSLQVANGVASGVSQAVAADRIATQVAALCDAVETAQAEAPTWTVRVIQFGDQFNVEVGGDENVPVRVTFDQGGTETWLTADAAGVNVLGVAGGARRGIRFGLTPEEPELKLKNPDGEPIATLRLLTGGLQPGALNRLLRSDDQPN